MIRTILAMLAFLIAYGIVGTMDYADAQRQAEHYDRMVCSGAWPDYDDREPNCDEVNR